MPDVWTHLIAGDMLLGGLQPGVWRSAAHEFRPMFDFGCQGTDFFFYYNFWPWVKDKSATAIGETVHHTRCREFHRAVFVHLKNQKQTKDYQAAVVYGLGLLCHWAVDRNTHPYIHYISGFYDSGDPATHHLLGNHKRIEGAIDTILAKEYWDIEAHLRLANERFRLGGQLPGFLTDLYNSAISTVYSRLWSVQRPGCIEQSYRDMMRACRFFFDPGGLKRQLLSLVAKQLNPSAYFYPHQVSQEADYLNRQHRQWVHPADYTETYTHSFDELLSFAVVDAGLMIEATLAWLKDELDEAQWLETLGDISFSTGKDSGQTVQLKYCQPILD